MNLTSWQRLRYQLGGDTPLSDTGKNKRKFLNWIPVISNRVESFLNRRLELVERIDYFDALPETLEYFPDAYPITNITSVKSDTLGEFTGGSDVSEVDFYIGQEGRSFVLSTPIQQTIRGIQVTYTGGLATHGTQSQFTLTSEGSTEIAVGDFVRARTSLSFGIVVSKSGPNITIEILYGSFLVGEIIDVVTNEDSAPIANTEATIDTSVVRCMAELHPELVQACEMEIRYMDDHRSDYENYSTMKNMTARKSLTVRNGATLYELLPETMSLLQPLVNIGI